MHIERAHGVDAERVLVGRDAVGRDAGQVDDGIGAGEDAEHLSENLNVAREEARAVVIRRLGAIEDRHLMRR